MNDEHHEPRSEEQRLTAAVEALTARRGTMQLEIGFPELVALILPPSLTPQA